MRKSTKTVLAVLAGVVVLVGVTVVGLGFWFFTSVVETTPADVTQASASFSEVRARFLGGEPVLEMTGDGPRFVRQPPAEPVRSIETIRLIAWAPDEGELARVAIPFWLVQMRDGPFSISSSTFVPNLKLTVRAADLERYGPAILIDHQNEDGERVLIWTE